jgi:membrane protein implicated in regulation of membrane protease activity
MVFAHPGHWAIQLVYVAPLAALVVILIRAKVQERRERRADPDGSD